jgi:hypothetical protein
MMKMSEELENIEEINENDDLEDLIEEHTIINWKYLKEKISNMDTKSLVETMVMLELLVNKTLALEISKRDDAVFHLRKLIQDGSYWEEDGQGKGWTPIHTIHILPLIRNEKAMQLLLDIFRYRRNDITNRIIGEITGLLYHFGEDGIKSLIEFTKDETLEPFARAEAVTSLVALARTYPSHKDEIKGHIANLIEVTQVVSFASLIADDLAAFQDKSMLPQLKKAFRDGRINDIFIAEEEIESIIKGTTQFDMERYTKDPLTYFSRENIEELYSEYYTDQEIDEDEKWSFNPDILETEDDTEIEHFEPEDQRKNKKVGRNAPCPCGSGQKYKKCCMKL